MVNENSVMFNLTVILKNFSSILLILLVFLEGMVCLK